MSYGESSSRSARTLAQIGAVAAVLASWVPSVSAQTYQGTQQGIVANVYVSSTLVSSNFGIAVVVTGGAHSGKPPCAVADFWTILDENSVTGKQQYQAVLFARATGATVWIYGAGTCTRRPGSEDVDQVVIVGP